jgi:hypothetical protein
MWKSHSKKGKDREVNIEEELQNIEVEFSQDPEQSVVVHSRLKPDLPKSIVGFAWWYKSSNPHKSSYLLKSNAKWWPIEYINSHWYYLTWNNKSEEYWVSQEDKVLSPMIFGLETPSTPYEVRGEEVKSEEETPATTEEAEETKEPKSDPDTPVATRAEAEEVEELSTYLEQTSIGPVPFWTDASLVEQEELTGKYPPALSEE